MAITGRWRVANIVDRLFSHFRRYARGQVKGVAGSRASHFDNLLHRHANINIQIVTGELRYAVRDRPKDFTNFE